MGSNPLTKQHLFQISLVRCWQFCLNIHIFPLKLSKFYKKITNSIATFSGFLLHYLWPIITFNRYFVLNKLLGIKLGQKKIRNNIISVQIGRKLVTITFCNLHNSHYFQLFSFRPHSLLFKQCFEHDIKSTYSFHLN